MRIGLGISIPGQSGVPWSPLSLGSALMSWHRGDLGVTLNGSTVSEWADQSGNAHTFSQGVAANQPTYVASDSNFGGQSSVQFLGTNDKLDHTATWTAPTALDLFCVLLVVNDPGTGVAATGSGPFQMGSWSPGTLSALYTHSDGDVYMGAGSTTRKTTAFDPAPGLITVKHALRMISVAGEWTMEINGTQRYTTATNTVGWDTTPILGASDLATDWFFVGRIAELITMNAKASAAQLADIEAYLSARYGVTFA